MYRLYHACYYKNADGRNRLIAPGKDCILRTSRCLWKDPGEVISGVKRDRAPKTKPCVNLRTVDKYYTDKEIKAIDIM